MAKEKQQSNGEYKFEEKNCQVKKRKDVLKKWTNERHLHKKKKIIIKKNGKSLKIKQSSERKNRRFFFLPFWLTWYSSVVISVIIVTCAVIIVFINIITKIIILFWVQFLRLQTSIIAKLLGVVIDYYIVYDPIWQKTTIIMTR